MPLNLMLLLLLLLLFVPVPQCCWESAANWMVHGPLNIPFCVSELFLAFCLPSKGKILGNKGGIYHALGAYKYYVCNPSVWFLKFKCPIKYVL